MADPTNYQQFNQRTTELVQVVTDALKAAYGLENISQGEALGLLAGIDNLSSAPVGNVGALLSALGFNNVLPNGRNVNGPWPTSTLDDFESVGADVYYCGGDVNDKPYPAFGICLHLPIFSSAYQIYFSGFSNSSSVEVLTRFAQKDDNGNWIGTDWREWLSKPTHTTDRLQVAKNVAEQSGPDSLGGYIFAVTDTACWHGQTTAGANLTPCGIQANGAIAQGDNGKTRTGTWRCLGRGAAGDATLWQKVAD
ncbi:hypothetical protein [Halomonas caseinilytica]|uniref:Uncharacterized protein n=1 Tax=Halomonas caseinilytica TaxID=438744 RepID=A0A1M6UFP3_9GAMM|nr:hypothetical protein [Halomonas caseinilytica]SHK67989.1 hypothetical protein SAMN05192556_104251 [Halomonas caseinilytica]